MFATFSLILLAAGSRVQGWGEYEVILGKLYVYYNYVILKCFQT
jgi:hypothetical protein